MKKILLVLFLIVQIGIRAQGSAAIRGTVKLKSTQQELAKVNIRLITDDSVYNTITDTLGKFRFNAINQGRITIEISQPGFQFLALQNLLHSGAKELILQIELEEKVNSFNTIFILANRNSKPINNSVLSSGRSFSVEETQRYAAAMNDPARLASSFAGVNTPSDGNNFISVRGNSPNTLLWRMEGIDIPNPNHFTSTGTQGGGISILSAQLLSNSDFITAAFPAEYGNATGAVFDLHLRKGNNEKHEKTIQLGLLGLEMAVEGPISKKKESSYLINYRNSTLSILSKLGINLGPSTINFSDLSYHFNYHLNKKLQVSLFGFAGWSNQTLYAPKDTAKRDYYYQWHDFTYGSNSSVSGLKWQYRIGKNATLVTTQAFTRILERESDKNRENESNLYDQYKVGNETQKISSFTQFTQRLGTGLEFKAGLNVHQVWMQYKIQAADSWKKLTDYVNQKADALHGGIYAQIKARISGKINTVLGLHSNFFSLSKEVTMEPRLGFSYQFLPKTALVASYGSHSQINPLIVYFAKDANGLEWNRKLKMSRAKHYVLGIKHQVNKNWNTSLEGYLQTLSDLPISTDPNSTFSLVNNLNTYYTKPLTNKGLGKNIGIEFILEKIFRKSNYLLLATSIYKSQYQALDKIWRSTTYNGGRTVSITAGKEWKWNKKHPHIFAANMKLLWLGGNREMPVLAAESQLQRTTIFDEQRAFDIQLPDYFRADIRVSLRKTNLKTASVIALDIQNVTNYQNIGGSYYDLDKQQIARYYQLPLLPVLSYKLEF